MKCSGISTHKKLGYLKKKTPLPFISIIIILIILLMKLRNVSAWHRLERKMWSQWAKSNTVLLSPQLDEPVQDEEDKKAEEQHVAQEFCLTASGQLLDSADGGTEQSACRVKV